jgi:hypothetical protein
VWPAVRRHFGALLVVLGVGATLLVPIATGSGENLERRLGAEELVHQHSEWGERMLPSMIVLLVCILVLVLLDILRRTTSLATTGEAMRSTPAAGDLTGGRGAISTAERTTLAAPAAVDEGRLTVVDRWIGARLPRQLRTAAAELWARRLEAAFAVLCVVAGLVTLYVVFQTGESGAKAVWSGR